MSTTTDWDFVDMRVSDVRRIVRSGRDHHVVVLQEATGDRRVPIWIGREPAIEIAIRLLGHGSQLARPLASDLTARLVEALGGDVREIRIDRLTENTYYAVIVANGPQGIAEVDARPSDALALALVVGSPVRVDRQVVETSSASDDAVAFLAAVDGQEAAGPQALLEELTEEAPRQAPPGSTRP